MSLLPAAGCAGPPEQADLSAYLVSEAALPRQCEKAAIRVFREDVGDFQPDSTDLYRVVASETCFDSWRGALAASADWNCNWEAGECLRGPVGARRDGKAERYREEWGTIRFLGAGLAQVELMKI
jgi:hypothetical protein